MDGCWAGRGGSAGAVVRLPGIVEHVAGSDDWYTPPHIFAALGLQFDCDRTLLVKERSTNARFGSVLFAFGFKAATAVRASRLGWTA